MIPGSWQHTALQTLKSLPLAVKHFSLANWYCDGKPPGHLLIAREHLGKFNGLQGHISVHASEYGAFSHNHYKAI